MKRMIRSSMAVLTVALLLLSMPAFAASAAVIDAKVDDAIETFKEEVNGAEVFLSQSCRIPGVPASDQNRARFWRRDRRRRTSRARPQRRILSNDGGIIRLAARRAGEVDRYRLHDARLAGQISQQFRLEGRCRRIGCAYRSWCGQDHRHRKHQGSGGWLYFRCQRVDV